MRCSGGSNRTASTSTDAERIGFLFPDDQLNNGWTETERRYPKTVDFAEFLVHIQGWIAQAGRPAA
jgi:hypothetical protein